MKIMISKIKIIRGQIQGKPLLARRGKAIKASGILGKGPKGNLTRVISGKVIGGRGEGKVMVKPVGAVISR